MFGFIWLGTNTQAILDKFLPFYPLGGLKLKLLKTLMTRDMIVHQCTKNYDHMMILCGVMAWDGQREVGKKIHIEVGTMQISQILVHSWEREWSRELVLTKNILSNAQ